MRKDWDSYFLDIAEKVAERSTCDRLNVGCVIVKDKLVVSTGYNGSIRGQDHCSESGHLYNDAGRCIRTIHAEQNAIIFASRDELQGSTAYVTHEPCETCTKLLLQAGITRIVFKHSYKNSTNHLFIKDIAWEKHEQPVAEETLSKERIDYIHRLLDSKERTAQPLERMFIEDLRKDFDTLTKGR
jgi:dCMP deaminase